MFSSLVPALGTGYFYLDFLYNIFFCSKRGNVTTLRRKKNDFSSKILDEHRTSVWVVFEMC